MTWTLVTAAVTHWRGAGRRAADGAASPEHRQGAQLRGLGGRAAGRGGLGLQPRRSTGHALGPYDYLDEYFDMSIVLMPVEQALQAVGTTITSMETVGALMVARPDLWA